MAKKKYTKNQILYKKQVKRLKQAVRRLEKRGYVVSYDVPSELPKRVTSKTLDKLKKITPKVLREEHSTYVDRETGEVLTGKQGEIQEKENNARRREEKKNTQKDGERYDSTQGYLPNGGDIIIDNIIDDLISSLSEPTPYENIYGGKKRKDIYETIENCRLTLYRLLMRKIAEGGRGEMGWRLHQHANELKQLFYTVVMEQ